MLLEPGESALRRPFALTRIFRRQHWGSVEGGALVEDENTGMVACEEVGSIDTVTGPAGRGSEKHRQG